MYSQGAYPFYQTFTNVLHFLSAALLVKKVSLFSPKKEERSQSLPEKFALGLFVSLPLLNSLAQHLNKHYLTGVSSSPAQISQSVGYDIMVTAVSDILGVAIGGIVYKYSSGDETIKTKRMIISFLAAQAGISYYLTALFS